MEYKINFIIDVVCEICNVDRTQLLSNSRKHSLPVFRGFLWYVIRRVTRCSNSHIAKVTATSEREYTGAAVGVAINKAMELIYREKYWRKCWDDVATKLQLSNSNIDEQDDIDITIVVPKGRKNKVNVKIKEKF